MGIADKYPHRLITCLDGAKADNNTTLKKINLVLLKIKPKTLKLHWHPCEEHFNILTF